MAGSNRDADRRPARPARAARGVPTHWHAGARTSDGNRGETRSDRGGDSRARRANPRGSCASFMSAPFVSIVVTARHDNYGGPYVDRIIKPLEFNCARLSEAGVAFELIVIEWDPVPGQRLLSDLLTDHLPQLASTSMRRIIVAAEYQAALTQNPKAGYFEYIAKNVGIRRAEAPFVLVTNVDVLLGREVVEVLADRRLAPGTIHRAARI